MAVSLQDFLHPTVSGEPAVRFRGATSDFCSISLTLQGGPQKPVISGGTWGDAMSRVKMTPVTQLISAIYRGPITPTYN